MTGTNEHSCLTGGAGTGKSYLTSAIKEAAPSGTVLCATTGQAAQLIGGRTLHSFIGLIPRKGLINPCYIEDRFCACARLIIDEVSMLSDVIFEYLIERCDDLNHYPQLVLVGDFLQLKPVDRDDDESVKHSYVFNSPYWKSLGIKVHQLTQQHRQSDPDFISALNDIRVGRLTANVINLISSRIVKELPDDCTQLFSTRAAVHEINSKHVLGLGGALDCFPGTVWKDPKKEKAVNTDRFRFPTALHLKPNARIVMLNNDKDHRWVNGSTGIIHSLGRNMIKVVLDSGYEGVVEPICEEQFDGDGRVMATMKQYPLMLAKAMTIHKAQGMTLDRVGVGLDRHFSPGMSYTALSRARSREGLFLFGTPRLSGADPEALAFYRNN